MHQGEHCPLRQADNSFLVKARWYVSEKKVGSKQSDLLPPLLRYFHKESATRTQYALELDNAIRDGQVPQHRGTQKSQADGLEKSGPASREQTLTGARTMPYKRNMREALHNLIIKFYMLLIKQKVPLLTSVTSMTLMAASWPVLTWRPWVRQRENSQHQHLTQPFILHRVNHLDRSSSHWVFPSHAGLFWHFLGNITNTLDS